MKPSLELDAVSQDAARLRARGTPYFLATVVRVEGTPYRRPAARMLVAEEQWLSGAVSGCLERDVLRRADSLIRRGPSVVRYDVASDDDIRDGLGLGSTGVVDILLERIDAKSVLDPMRFVADCMAAEVRGVLVTVFSSSSNGVPVGARMCVRGGEVVASTIASGPVYEAFASEARTMLSAPFGTARARELCVEGTVALMEPVLPVPHVFVIGSGHDAVPLVGLARAIGLRATVVDARASFSMRERFADVDRVLIGPPQGLARAIDEREAALAVVMTHDYERDRSYLGALVGTRARYIGMLGPKSRTDRMLAELGRHGLVIGERARARIHAPAGLDLGAVTPHETALSIVAEMQATLTNASGRRLREHDGAFPSSSKEASRGTGPS